MNTYARYTRAQIKDLFSWEYPPENLGPDDEDEDEDSMEEEQDEDPNYDNPADDYGSDNPADDYIMTERELRGEL